MDFPKIGNSANPWYCWWPEVELNHRHTDFQSVALPTELSGLFEGSIYRINGMSPTALRKGRSGAVGETRTPTHFHAHEPESCVSTNSTTTALKLLGIYNMILFHPETTLGSFVSKTHFSNLYLPSLVSHLVTHLRSGYEESIVKNAFFFNR